MPKTTQDTQIKALLKDTFHHRTFRPGQEAPIKALLSQQDVLLVMPTGSGKSLCYQLPALILPGTTLVISPLISLMQDQVTALQNKGIPSACLNSTQTNSEIAKILKALPKNKYKLLYIAPERIQSQPFQEALKATNISSIIIDEAHCISCWGHDFRPDYLDIPEIQKLFPYAPIMALTATATQEVREDIITQLHLNTKERPNPKTKIIIQGLDRPNLHLSVQKISIESAKLEAITAQLSTPSDLPAIIYTATRKAATLIHDFIKENTKKPPYTDLILYHAGLPDAQRTQALHTFQQSQAPLVIATKAFGMGIDRPDIRTIIHFNIPGTLEDYYQEIGRAGRDNKPSRCLLIYTKRDIHTQKFFIDASNPTYTHAIQALDALKTFPPDEYISSDEIINEIAPPTTTDRLAITTVLNLLSQQKYLLRRIIETKDQPPKSTYTLNPQKPIPTTHLKQYFSQREQKLDHDLHRLDKIIDYAENPYTCRHQLILDYFGAKIDTPTPCTVCDNCTPKRHHTHS